VAVACARCGAQNPDGNQFCQACGTPLAAVAAPPTSTAPPLAYASPPPTPVAYASPYYSPVGAAPQAPVHRTPWVLLVSAVVVLIVVMAGCGTAIALIGKNTANQAGGIAVIPSPSPGVSPSPIASPNLPIGPDASNEGVTIPVPAGWSVANKDTESITLVDPNGDGSVTVASGLSNPSQTAQENKDTLDRYLTSKYPDTRTCPNSKATNGTLNGVSGIAWTLCFTLTSSGQSVTAAADLFAGANSDGGVYYLAMLVTSQANLQALESQSQPILQGIQWKLK
jgi:zinc ribbon protein